MILTATAESAQTPSGPNAASLSKSGPSQSKVMESFIDAESRIKHDCDISHDSYFQEVTILKRLEDCNDQIKEHIQNIIQLDPEAYGPDPGNPPTDPYYYRVSPRYIENGFLKLPGLTGPFVAMDYLEDDPNLFWSESSTQLRQFTSAEVASVIKMAFAKLEALHEASILHKDIKRRNMILRITEHHGPIVVFLDFAFSKYPNKYDGINKQTKTGRRATDDSEWVDSVWRQDVCNLCMGFGIATPANGSYNVMLK